MTLIGLLLGIVNIAIAIAVLVLIGAIVVWVCGMFQVAVSSQVQRIYLIVVLLIGLYMLIALLAGMPTIRIIQIPTS